MRLGRLGIGELLAVVGGAGLVAAAFQPWHSVELSAAASETITRAGGLEPLRAQFFEHGLREGFTSQQPLAWEVFDRAQYVLAALGAVAALVGLLAVAGVVHRSPARMVGLGLGALVVVGYRLVLPPVEGQAAVQVEPGLWGWIALAAAVAILGSSFVSPLRLKATGTHALDRSVGRPGTTRVPGWYHDPYGPGLRYWDGASWTWKTRESGLTG